MVLQRRYSVTGQTPPDDVQTQTCDTHGRSQQDSKLQVLDTTMQTASCSLCEAGGGNAGKSCAAAIASTATTSDTPVEGAGAGGAGTGHGGGGRDGRGRKLSHHPAVRTSSKRSATQLPSPNTPSSHELPTKIARRGIEDDEMDIDVDVDEGSMTDPFPEESDWALSASEGCSSNACPSPMSPHSVSDEMSIEPLRLTIPDDTASDDFALSPPDALPMEPPQPEPMVCDPAPLTFLTLPPEIRHEIYRYVPDLVVSHPLIYCLSTFPNNMQHPLASVSSLVRSEALAIFYSYNTWTIKLEFKMMYEAFQDWIIRLGDGASCLRLVNIAVRGCRFKPKSSHAPSSIGLNGQMLNQPVLAPHQVAGQPPVFLPGAPIEEYCPPDGDASFKIDLSEKFPGGRVELVRCDGTKEAGEQARVYLAKMVARLWERRRMGTLNGQDWVWMVDEFLTYTGWW